MTYVINNYDGTTLVSIADRTVNTTRTSIKLPGRDYPRYGEPVVENLVWMLQHFAAPSSPANPITGQVWYDTNAQTLKVYSGTGWIGTGKTVVGGSFPVIGEPGQIFYNTAKRQLFVYDASNSPVWKLVGPIGAYDNSDPLLSATSYSNVEAAKVTDDASAVHSIIKIVVGGQLLAIISSDPVFVPAAPGIVGFPSIAPGINLRNTAGTTFVGQATSAATSTNASELGGASAAVYMRTDQSNLPTQDSQFDLGATNFKYANVWATTFQGTATSARYADLAERYEIDCAAQPAQLVKIGGSKEITLTNSRGCENVLGVISTNPAVMLNSSAGDDQTHPYIALTGRVPLQVVGPVVKGQRLMSSEIAGVACAWDPSCSVFSVVGRSLETKSSDQIDIVEAIVGKF